MTTERSAPDRSAAPKKKTRPAATKQSELRAARAFALQYNFGLSSRVREMLDGKKDILQVLVDEHLPIGKIQEFIQQEYGPKIGTKALNSYLVGTFPGRVATAPAPAAKGKTRKP